jgi:hypothetical protein
MTIKSMITTKAIAFPSSRFLSMWTLIEQHSSLRKLQQNNKPWQPPFQQRVSNARSTAALWVRRIRAIQIRIWKTPKRSHSLLGVGIPVPDGERFGLAVFARHGIRFKKKRSSG